MAKIRTIKTKEYILENERSLPPIEQSVFHLRDLNPYQSAEIYDILFESGTFNLTIKAFVKAGELGIVGWKNVLNEENKEIEYTKHTVKMLPTNILTEIGLDILKSTFPEFETALGSPDINNEDGEKENPLV